MMKCFLLTLLFSTLAVSAPSFANEKSKCRKQYQMVSCADIENATREYYCSKSKPSEKRKAMICTKKSKKKKIK